MLTSSFRKEFVKIFDLPEDTAQAWEFAFDFISHRIFELVKKYYEDKAFKNNQKELV
ncbi:hypothetical protein [Persephonella sp.]|uniref:hypothetical protein n=1 Tax=Persephonella sp. TaxID=2060922 RepID=UPI0026133757|nr:hypothetical protein [Persephonella sp.]